ncbi:Ste50 protein [Saccharomycopsis crataegensis]|uniref:Ste50 protein n=1 Tax=Saccharomycopsis crataegensis TaxID=43959 RepID=A0AAV5QWS4_9ASCO|nr:Ste50 protein [Saccharomycopsis crataegensis]
MNRKNMKRPESLLLDQNSLNSSFNLESNEPSSKEHDNYNVAFKNSFSLKKSSKNTTSSSIEVNKNRGSGGSVNNLRIVSINNSTSSSNSKPMSPVSPKYLEKNNDKKFYDWTRIEVHNWIVNLTDLNRISKSQETARTFLEHNVTGDILPYLNMQHFNDMNIKELKIKLLLKKNIESLLVQFMDKYSNDEGFDEILLNSHLMNNYNSSNVSSALYNDYSIALTEQVLTNLSDQIIRLYSSRVQDVYNNTSGANNSSSDINTGKNNSKSSTRDKSVEKMDHDLKKLHQNFQRFKEDVAPVVKHYKTAKANVSANSSISQTPIENNYFLNSTLTPSSLNGSPSIVSPMRNIASPTNQPLYNKRSNLRDSLEDSLGGSTGMNTIQDEDLNGSKKKSGDRMLLNPFKERKDYDRSPLESTYEASVHSNSSFNGSSTQSQVAQQDIHQRTLSNSSIKAGAITVSKNLLTGTPSPTVGTSAYQTAQTALQTPNSGTYPPLSHQQSNVSLYTSSSVNNYGGSNALGVLSAPSSSTHGNFNSPTTIQGQQSIQQSPGPLSGVSSTPTGVRTEPLKQLKAKYDDPCYKVLQKAMIKHKINNVDWRNYVLVICYGDKERILGPEEKPVKVFKELQDKGGQHPSFMIRQLEAASPSSDRFDDDGNTSGAYSSY